MKKLLKKIFVNQYKSIFQIILKSKSKFFDFNHFSLNIRNNCELGEKGDEIYLRFDEIIAPNVINKGSWDEFVVKFLKRKIGDKNYTFIDLGANIGLITRQIIEQNLNQIKEFHCIEPETNNFRLLKKNLSKYSSNKIFFYKNAITNSNDTQTKLYINPNNFGDYGILQNNSDKFEIVNTLNINQFFSTNINTDNCNIIYKSDIQGMDEMVLLSMKDEIINKIDILIIEISNPKYLSKNLDKFKEILNKFNTIETDKNSEISLLDIEKKIKNYQSFDLLLSKL